MDEPIEGSYEDVPFFWSAEDRFLAAVYRGYLVASPIVDSFSNWSFGVAGVAVAGLLSGLGDLPGNLRRASIALVGCLIVAGFFALLNKVGRLSVAAAVNSSGRVARELNRLGEEGLGSLNWEEVDNDISRPLIWPYSSISKAMARRGDDRLFGLRYAVIWMQVQGIAVVLQTLTLLFGAALFMCAAL